MKVSYQAIAFAIIGWAIGHYRGLQSGYLRGCEALLKAQLEHEKKEELEEGEDTAE